MIVHLPTPIPFTLNELPFSQVAEQTLESFEACGFMLSKGYCSPGCDTFTSIWPFTAVLTTVGVVTMVVLLMDVTTTNTTAEDDRYFWSPVFVTVKVQLPALTPPPITLTVVPTIAGTHIFWSDSLLTSDPHRSHPLSPQCYCCQQLWIKLWGWQPWVKLAAWYILSVIYHCW